jgi:hypothetical protein
MQQAQWALEKLLKSNETSRGMTVRVHNESLIASREEGAGTEEESQRRDCVRLTRINVRTWGLSVRRHTGRWERTPFVGTMDDIVAAIWTYMQHLVARW